MNRKELIASIAAKTNSSKTEVGRNIEAMIDIMTQCVKHGESIVLTGFGALVPRTRAPRTGRNPATGAAVKIAARKTVTFRCGTTLKATLNGKK